MKLWRIALASVLLIILPSHFSLLYSKELIVIPTDDGGVVTLEATELSQEEITTITRRLEQIDILDGKIKKLKPNLDLKIKKEIINALVDVSEKYSIDPCLILAIAYHESSLNPKARGLHGEYGLLQVMPFWATELDFVDRPEDLLQITTNIQAGTHILNDYMSEFNGNRRLALTAYNRGDGAVQVALMNHRSPYNGYADQVLQDYNRITRY